MISRMLVLGKKMVISKKYCDEAMRIIESTPIIDEVKDAIFKKQ